MSETGSIPKSPPAAAYGRDTAAPETPEARTATPPAEPEPPHADPAIRLAGRLANLAIGQAILGDVLLQQEEGRALLRTPRGDFAVDPSRALPARGSVEILLTRVTPGTDGSDLTGLLIARDGEPVDPPQTVRLTLVRLPQAPLATPAQPAAPPAPLKILLEALPEAARSALAEPVVLAGAALPQPTQGTLRAGLIPPVVPQSVPVALPGATAPATTPLLPTLLPGVPVPFAPISGPLLPPATIGTPVLTAPQAPALTVVLAPAIPASITGQPAAVPVAGGAPLAAATPPPLVPAILPAALPAPAAVSPLEAQPALALAAGTLRQSLAPEPRQVPPARDGLASAPLPAIAAAGPAPTSAAATLPEFSADPWLRTPPLALLSAEGRPLGHVSVVAAEPVTAHSLLRSPTPDSPLGRLVSAGRLLIAETQPERPSTSPAAPAVLRIAANSVHLVLESPPDLPVDGPAVRLLLLHTGTAETPAAELPPPAALAVNPAESARAPFTATIAFLFKALGRQGFRVEALEPLARLPDVLPITRVTGESLPPEPPRLQITLQPPNPHAPPIQAVLWFQHHTPQDHAQGEADDKIDPGTGFHVDVTFPGLGDSRLSGAVRAHGLDLRFASRNPVTPALQASTQAVFTAALGDRSGRLGFQLLGS